MTYTPDQVIHHKIPYIKKIFFPTAILVRLYTNYNIVYMLWFKFFLGLMFFEPVSILFAIVPDYGN